MDGVQLMDAEAIEEEILKFYTELVGSRTNDLRGIDLKAICNKKTLSNTQGMSLIKPVIEKEVWKALSSIGNSKASRIDGYNAYFFKIAWHI